MTITRIRYNIFYAVSPRWKIKPQDTTVIVGEDAFLHCQAEGFPEPSIQWMWSHGKTIIFRKISNQDTNPKVTLTLLRFQTLTLEHLNEK